MTTDTTRRRGRKPKGQGSFADVRVEDDTLEEDLATVAETADAVIRRRAALDRIRERLAAEHADAINADLDGIHSGFVICGAYRFPARNRRRPAEEGKIKKVNVTEGIIWTPFKVEVVDLTREMA